MYYAKLAINVFFQYIPMINHFHYLDYQTIYERSHNFKFKAYLFLMMIMTFDTILANICCTFLLGVCTTVFIV